MGDGTFTKSVVKNNTTLIADDSNKKKKHPRGIAFITQYYLKIRFDLNAVDI